LMTKEVVEATAPGGVLHRWRRVLAPVCAAIGGAAVPALMHTWLAERLDEPVLRMGWPATFATDLALAYLAVRLIFGKSHAAIPFTILLAIAANTLGFLAVASFSPTRETGWIGGLGLLVLAMVLAGLLRRWRIRSFWPYVLGAGALSWLAFYWSGVHPALALVPIIPFLPHAARDPGFFADADTHAPDALSQFEVFWRYPAQVALFFFGLVNAGITSGSLEEGTWALPISVLIGKPIGVLLGAGLATVAGLHLPHRVGWRELMVIGFSAAIALSVGLFFSEALIPPGQLRSEISMGVLMTAAGLPAAVLVAWLLGVGRYRHPTSTVASEVE
jgi:NhaA family Na+:H+ antiporter